MDVSALNIANPGLAPDDGAMTLPGAPATGDAFAKLLSGLGLTASPDGMPVESGEATPEATPPVDPVLVVPGAALLRAAAKTVGGAPTEEAPQAPTPEGEPAEAAETPTPDSLGLPPLLAALVAPTLSQAAAKPTEATPVLVTAPAVTVQPAPTQLPLTQAPPIADGDLALTAPPATPDTPAPVALPIAIASPPADPAKAALVVATQAEAKAPPATVEQQAAMVAPPLPGRAQPSMRTGGASQAPEKIDVKAAEPARPAERPLPIPLPVAVITPPVVDLAALTPAPANDLTALGAATAPAAPADGAVERQLDIARDGVWLDQLTKDIVRTASAEGSLRFRLNPENLGSLQVEVTQGQHGASVRLTADTEAARAIIADARPQLVAEARAQGLRIAETHVDLSNQGQSQAHSQAGQGGNRGRDVPAQEYLTSWKPESAEEDATPTRRSAAERYA